MSGDAETNSKIECIKEYSSLKPVQRKIQNIKQSLTHYPAPEKYHFSSQKFQIKFPKLFN